MGLANPLSDLSVTFSHAMEFLSVHSYCGESPRLALYSSYLLLIICPVIFVIFLPNSIMLILPVAYTTITLNNVVGYTAREPVNVTEQERSVLTLSPREGRN